MSLKLGYQVIVLMERGGCLLSKYSIRVTALNIDRSTPMVPHIRVNFIDAWIVAALCVVAMLLWYIDLPCVRCVDSIRVMYTRTVLS